MAEDWFDKHKPPEQSKPQAPAPSAPDAPPGAESTAQPDGFFRSAWNAFNPIPAIKLGAELFSTGLDPANPVKTIKAGTDVWEGVLKPQWDMVQKGSESLHEGRPVESLDYYGAAVLPGAGPNIMHGYEQMQAGNMAGAAGTWAGTFASLGLGELGARGASKLSKIAPEVYRKGLDLKVGKGGVKRSEATQAVERGLGRNVPAKSPPGAPTISSESGFEDIETRIGDTKKRQMAEIDKADASGVKIPTDKVVKPLEDLINRWRKVGWSKAPNTLQEALDGFNKKHPRSIIGPKEVQELKEITGEILGDPAFKEGAALSGEKTAGDQLRDAMQATLESVAPVKDLNWAMHLDYILTDAVDRALNNRNFLKNLLTTGGLGGFTTYEMAKGNLKVAAGSTAATIVSAAMQSPKAMTKLAVALDKAGIALPPMARGAGAAGFAIGGDRKAQSEAPPGAITVKSADEIIKQWQSEAASSGSGSKQ